MIRIWDSTKSNHEQIMELGKKIMINYYRASKISLSSCVENFKGAHKNVKQVEQSANHSYTAITSRLLASSRLSQITANPYLLTRYPRVKRKSLKGA